MRAMKDSGVEWIGEIPREWEVSSVKYFIDCYDGKRRPIDASLRVSGEYPYWGAGSITDYVNDYLFDEELVLLGEDGAPFFDDSRPVAFLITDKIWVNNHIHVLKPHKDIATKFLMYFLNSVDYRTYINGSILNKLTQSNMNNIAFVVAPLPTQRRIADYLDDKCGKIDAIIAREKAVIEKLKEYKLSVITEAVTKGLNPDAPMKDSGVEWMGEIPEHWEVTNISRIASVVRGASPRPAGDPFYFHGHDVPWITVAEVTKGEGKYIYETETYLTSEGAKKSRIVEAGTLLLSNSGATLGVPKVTQITGCINDGSVAFHNLKINQMYLLYLFKSRTFELRKQMQGYGQPNLNTTIIKGIEIPLPHGKEQIEICAFLDKKCNGIDSAITQKQAVIEKLTGYKKSIIYEVVTGKKEV